VICRFSLRFSLMSWSIIPLRDSTNSGPPCRRRRRVAVARVDARAPVVRRGRRAVVLEALLGRLVGSSDIIILRCHIPAAGEVLPEYNAVIRQPQTGSV
jgi:hypothetical protein